MTSQISWLDFGDVANWTGAKTIQVAKKEVKPNELEEALALQVGATYTKGNHAWLCSYCKSQIFETIPSN